MELPIILDKCSHMSIPLQDNLLYFQVNQVKNKKNCYINLNMLHIKKIEKVTHKL